MLQCNQDCPHVLAKAWESPSCCQHISMCSPILRPVLTQELFIEKLLKMWVMKPLPFSEVECVVCILLPWKGHEQQPKYFAQICDSYLSKSFLIHVIHVPFFFLTFLRRLEIVFPKPAFSAEVHISFSTLIFLSINTTASRQGQAAVRGGKFSKALAKWWHECHFTLICLGSYPKSSWSPGSSGAIRDML